MKAMGGLDLRGKIKIFTILSIILLIVLTPIYIYIILPNLKPTPTLLSSKTITLQLRSNKFPIIVNRDFYDIGGWNVEKGRVEVTETCYLTGSRSFYAQSDNGEFTISQKINSTIYDYNYIKDRKIVFNFWFKPLNVSKDGLLNYAWAEIKYLNNGNITSIIGNKVYPTENKWYCAFVLVYIPSNVEEITVSIHGNSSGNKGFHGYIDTASLEAWENVNISVKKGKIALSVHIINIYAGTGDFDAYLGVGFFVKSSNSNAYVIKSLEFDVISQDPEHITIPAIFDFIQANDENLDVDKEKEPIYHGWGAFHSGVLASFCNVSEVTIKAENSDSNILVSFHDRYLKNFSFYRVRLDKKTFYQGYPIGGYAEWKYPSGWSKNNSNYVTTVLGGTAAIPFFLGVPWNRSLIGKVTFSLIVHWGQVVFHRNILGKYYSVRDAGLEMITLTIEFTTE